MFIPDDSASVLTQAFSNVASVLDDELDDFATELALDRQLLRKLGREGLQLGFADAESVSLSVFSIGGKGPKSLPREKGDILLIATFTDEQGKIAEKRALLQSKLQYLSGAFNKIALNGTQHSELVGIENQAAFSAYYLLYSRGIRAPKGCFVVSARVVHTLFQSSLSRQRKPSGKDLRKWIDTGEAMTLPVFIARFLICVEGRLVELMGYKSRAFDLLVVPDRPHSEIKLGIRGHAFTTQGEREYIYEDFPARL